MNAKAGSGCGFPLLAGIVIALAITLAATSASADGTRITIWSGPDASGWSISSGPNYGACRPMYRPNYRPQPQRWDNRYNPYPQPQRWGGSGDYMDDRPVVGYNRGYDRRAIEEENKRMKDALNERNRIERALDENARLRRALEGGCQRY